VGARRRLAPKCTKLVSFMQTMIAAATATKEASGPGSAISTAATGASSANAAAAAPVAQAPAGLRCLRPAGCAICTHACAQ